MDQNQVYAGVNMHVSMYRRYGMMDISIVIQIKDTTTMITLTNDEFKRLAQDVKQVEEAIDKQQPVLTSFSA